VPPRAIATIARRLAGIGFVHREAGHPSPAEHEGVRRTLRGIRRAGARAGAAPGKARPLGTEEVRLLVGDLPDTLAGRRDRATVLLGYALALRAGDLVAIDVTDLSPDPHGLRVRLRRGKSDQDGAGTILALVRGRRAATCPVRAVETWLASAGHPSGPLLRAVDRSGRVGTGRMATSSVYRLLRRAGAHAGLDLTDLSPHSLRRGHITTAAQAGAPERQIARTSRHASLVVLRGYITTPKSSTTPAAATSVSELQAFSYRTSGKGLTSDRDSVATPRVATDSSDLALRPAVDSAAPVPGVQYVVAIKHRPADQFGHEAAEQVLAHVWVRRTRKPLHGPDGLRVDERQPWDVVLPRDEWDRCPTCAQLVPALVVAYELNSTSSRPGAGTQRISAHAFDLMQHTLAHELQSAYDVDPTISWHSPLGAGRCPSCPTPLY